MAIDFFQQQDRARHKTGLLVLYFAIAVVSIAAASYLAVFGILWFATKDTPESPPFFNPVLMVAVVGTVGVIIGVGSLIKAFELRGGGKAVALALGGKEVVRDTTNPRERQLLNIVEEMSIASGIPVPVVFVLQHESCINALAAGHSSGDAVVAVSRGAIERLNRSELQGVVAHEFSHILNGDMRLNLRLISWIFGIMSVAVCGRLLLRIGTDSSGDSSSEEKGGNVGLYFVAVGIVFLLLGWLGVFFGRLIQAAIARQREYLADASALQFTRDPYGISGALKKIGGFAEHSRLKSARLEESSHMLFSDGFLGHRFIGLLASHPPLDERIRRMDPSFDGRYPEVPMVAEMAMGDGFGPTASPSAVPSKAHSATSPTPGVSIPGMPNIPGVTWPALEALPAIGIGPERAATHVGNVTPDAVDYASVLQDKFPPNVREALAEPFGARLLVYCLLLDARPDVRLLQLELIRQHAAPGEFEQTQTLAQVVTGLCDEMRLPLIDLAIPALRRMSPDQHQRFREQVAALVDADNQIGIFEYALQCVLARHLDQAFHVVQVPAGPGSPGLESEMIHVLSTLAWEGAADEAGALQAFSAGMRSGLFAKSDPPRLIPRTDSTLREFDTSLRRIAEASPSMKKRGIVAFAACILADCKVAAREFELLRAISATLDCPMPPLVVHPEAAAHA